MSQSTDINWNQLVNHTPHDPQTIPLHQTCPNCHGTGQCFNHGPGFSTLYVTCPACKGSGRIVNEWPEAEGEGITEEWIDSVVRGKQ